MRLLHVVPSYIPAYRYGGPIYSVHGLCKALVRRGHEVHVFTTNVNGSEDSDVPLGEPVLLDGVRVWYFKSPVLRRLFWSPGMRAALKRHIATFDLVHLHSVFLWPTSAAARAARRAGVPYVMAPRGMLVEELIGRRSALAKRLWVRLFERRNLRCASGIHMTTRREVRDFRKLGLYARNIFVVANGVEAGGESSGPARPLVKSESERTLLYLGRIHWKKGIERLIRALAEVPDVRLTMVGDDDEAYLEKVVRLADELGLRERVTYLGPVRGRDKADLYRMAALLVLPSYNENFGNVVLEAMAEGCPVLVTPEVGAAEIVRESNGGVVAKGEPPALAEAIRGMLADPHALSEMGRRGQEHVYKHYTWDRIGKEMEDIYRHLLARETGR